VIHGMSLVLSGYSDLVHHYDIYIYRMMEVMKVQTDTIVRIIANPIVQAVIASGLETFKTDVVVFYR